jgi:hypothetical protein
MAQTQQALSEGQTALAASLSPAAAAVVAAAATAGCYGQKKGSYMFDLTVAA